MVNAHDRTGKHRHAVAVGWITLPHMPILGQAGLLESSARSCRYTGDKNPWSHVGILHTHGDTDSLGRGLSWRQQWMLNLDMEWRFGGEGCCPPLLFPRLLSIRSHLSFSSSALWPTTKKPSGFLSCRGWLISLSLTLSSSSSHVPNSSPLSLSSPCYAP